MAGVPQLNTFIPGKELLLHLSFDINKCCIMRYASIYVTIPSLLLLVRLFPKPIKLSVPYIAEHQVGQASARRMTYDE
jgi:hypothetical protein